MKQTRNKVPSNIFRSFDLKAKVQFVFFREKDSMKSKYYVFNDYKQRNDLCLVYLKSKLRPS